MSKQYEPELGQRCYGNPWNTYEVTDFIEALFWYILKEAGRVHGNITQNHRSDGLLHQLYESGVNGIHVGPVLFRTYQWVNHDLHPEVAELPNFVFEDVEIRWYKHPGRGMSTNKDWKPEEWIEWFDRCLKALRDLDNATRLFPAQEDADT